MEKTLSFTISESEMKKLFEIFIKYDRMAGKEGGTVLDAVTVTGLNGIRRVWSPKGKKYTMENRRWYGISLCECGEIIYRHAGGETVSDACHAVLLPRGGSYRLEGTADGWFPMIDFSCTPDFQCDRITAFPLANPERCFRLFRQLQAQSLRPNGHAGMMALFYQLLEQIDHPEQQDETPMARAIACMDAHIGDSELSEAMLCRAAGVSGVWLRRLFTDNCGIPPKQMILQRRLQMAQRLLAEENDSVAEIALQCGFSDIYHFSRFFRQRTGMPPSRYRRITRETQII